mmetsp:Transcript_5506/g.12964  ORF Transcript_5506/g.12964 Transcript_5506/m.12964 type:complete len:100 (+) Transcript_5506:70-369(+)
MHLGAASHFTGHSQLRGSSYSLSSGVSRRSVPFGLLDSVACALPMGQGSLSLLEKLARLDDDSNTVLNDHLPLRVTDRIKPSTRSPNLVCLLVFSLSFL